MRDAIFYHSGKSHWKRKNVSDRYTERNQYPDFGQYSSASYTKTHRQSTSKYLYPGNRWWIGYLPLLISQFEIYLSPWSSGKAEQQTQREVSWLTHHIHHMSFHQGIYTIFYYMCSISLMCSSGWLVQVPVLHGFASYSYKVIWIIYTSTFVISLPLQIFLYPFLFENDRSR